MNNTYELVVIFDPNLSDSEVSQQLEKIQTLVKAHAGTVEKQDVWGRRELAYKIQKKSHGIYALMVFSGDDTTVSDLRRQLKINDFVLRSLVVDKDKYAPDFIYRPPTEGRDGVSRERGVGADELEPELEEAVV